MTARVDLRLDPEREQNELSQYLGERFELERLRHYEEQLEAEFASYRDEQTFYRRSRGYLYNLTASAMTGTKLPYLDVLRRTVAHGARLLDYGCGIGSDGLMLLEAGYRVEFADFDNPSTAFLRWRLAQRGLDAPVHDLSAGVPGGFDAAYAFDVIEHVPDPFAFLTEMESRAEIVEVNLLARRADEHAMHRELPLAALLGHVARHPLLDYQVLHRRSHLVVYRSERASPLEQAVGRRQIALGRLRRRIR